MNRSDLRQYFQTLMESTANEQNKRSMLSESKDPPEDPAYASQFGSHLDDDEETEEYEDFDREKYLQDLYQSHQMPHYEGDEEEDVEEMARFHVLQDDVDATLYRDNPDYRNAFKEALLNPPSDKADMSDEYRRMTLSPDRAYDKE